MFTSFGRYILLLRLSFRRPEKFSVYWAEIMREMVSVGIGSLGIIAIISVFIGAATAIQVAFQAMVGNDADRLWIASREDVAPEDVAAVQAGDRAAHGFQLRQPKRQPLRHLFGRKLIAIDGARLGQQQTRFQVGQPGRHHQIVRREDETATARLAHERKVLIGQARD